MQKVATLESQSSDKNKLGDIFPSLFLKIRNE